MAIETRDRKKLEAILRRDPIWGGYGLADLDDAVFARTRWLLSDDDGSAIALIYEFDGHQTVITYGEAEPAAVIIGELQIQGTCDLHLPVHHRESVGSLFEGRFEPYVRMGVPIHDFRPVLLPRDLEVKQLGAEHLEEVMALQEHYPDTAFQPGHLREELYIGGYHDERMVTMAGTHVCSEAYRVAAVGSVVTDPKIRGQGLGTAITSALCCRLLSQVELIVLNVGAENPSAQRVYGKLGFTPACDYFEGIAVREV